MTPWVLIVQTQPQIAQVLSRFFEQRGDAVTTVFDLGQAATELARQQPDLLVLDLHFPGDEWQGFLSLIRREYPELSIVITSRFPHVDRELKAQEIGVRSFVRQPFTPFLLNKALETSGFSPKPQDAGQPAAALERPTRSPLLTGLRVTGPLLLLALFFALAAAFVISQAVTRLAQNRFDARLAETRLQAADAMVKEEESLLRSLRLVSNVQGVSELVRNQDAERLRLVISPLITPGQEETVEILDVDGISILSAMRSAAGMEYEYSRGRDDFKDLPFVQAVLTAQVDAAGDKHAGLVEVDGRSFFYIASAIYDDDRPIGAALVGRSLESLASRLEQDTLAQVTLYDQAGNPLATTLFDGRDVFPLDQTLLARLEGAAAVSGMIRELQMGGTAYSEVVAPWKARRDLNLGFMSIALPQDFLIRGSQLPRIELFSLVAAGLALVTLTGLYLTGLITAPQRSLVQASAQLAQGDLNVKLDAPGSPEAADMTHTIHSLVTGLQEGMLYRDLLGQSVSPALREQLRESLSSGTLRLDGQEVVATILTSAVNGFSDIAARVEDPVQIFEWLNEYYSQLAPIVAAHSGVIYRLDGDVLVSFFGILPRMMTPIEGAQVACDAAVAMLQAVERLNARRLERGDAPMHTNIGIHTGSVIAGGLGSGDRLHFTLLGEAIDISRHLESLSRDIYHTNGILISQSTMAALNEANGRFHLDALGLHPVRRNAEKILVYRLLSPQSGPENKVTV
ncbi:MAG: cache domain-containing protein [Anaerolineaceae bacterium]|jgi:adenylate cyclase